MINQEKREYGSWWIWILALSVVSIVVLSGLSYVGIFTRTVVERKVFEQSYQRSEALKSQIATDEATIAEIEGKLKNPNLNDNTRYNLKAQLSAARIRISTARRKQ